MKSTCVLNISYKWTFNINNEKFNINSEKFNINSEKLNTLVHNNRKVWQRLLQVVFLVSCRHLECVMIYKIIILFLRTSLSLHKTPIVTCDFEIGPNSGCVSGEEYCDSTLPGSYPLQLVIKSSFFFQKPAIP